MPGPGAYNEWRGLLRMLGMSQEKGSMYSKLAADLAARPKRLSTGNPLYSALIQHPTPLPFDAEDRVRLQQQMRENSNLSLGREKYLDPDPIINKWTPREMEENLPSVLYDVNSSTPFDPTTQRALELWQLLHNPRSQVWHSVRN